MALFGNRKRHGKERPEMIAEYNRWRQVFKSEDWDSILEELKRISTIGSPVIYRRNMDVLQNDFCGVRAYKANVLFVFNGKPAPEWTHYEEYKNAPEPTTSAGTYFGAKDFDKSFPFIPVAYMAYTQPLVEKLVDNTYFNLKNSPKLVEFLADLRNSADKKEWDGVCIVFRWISEDNRGDIRSLWWVFRARFAYWIHLNFAPAFLEEYKVYS